MTVNPQSLRELGAFWVEHGGVNLGVVGDAAHTARPSYHNGQDVIDKNGWTAASDYSIRHERDREPHLTKAASAIDLGRLNGKLSELYRFSNWLVEQCQAGKPGATDVREVIYSPDGRKVQRYSGIDGQIHTGPGNGDASHIGHTHISYFRDSEQRDKRGLFEPFFVEDDMPPGVSLGSLQRSHKVIEIDDAGTLAIDIDGSKTTPLPVGARKETFMEAVVNASWSPSPGFTIPAGEPVYVVGDDAAILLKRNATVVEDHGDDTAGDEGEYVPIGQLYVKKEA